MYVYSASNFLVPDYGRSRRFSETPRPCFCQYIYMPFFAGEFPVFNQVQSSFGEYWFYDLCIGGHADFVVPTYK